MKIELENGAVCLVGIKGSRGIRPRVFKWMEKRFGEILCYVFSAPCQRDVRVKWNPAEKSLTISGRKVPCSEVSVPYYDLQVCEPIRNRKEQP